jgi:DNA-binding NtrC family response regulator
MTVTTPKKSILIVDDEEDLSELLVDHFKMSDFNVFQAPDIHQAYELFKLNPIDVVLTDMRMPQGSGIELTEKIRKENQKIPIFILTGFADINKEESIQRRVTDMISKPFDLDQLLSVVLEKLS